MPRAARPIKRVHFLEYNAKVNTLSSRPLLPKYGTPLLASILKERGLDVQILLEDVSDMSFEKWRKVHQGPHGLPARGVQLKGKGTV